MIHEIAELSINADDAAAFEAAVTQAAPLFKAAKGCRSFALQRCMETPGRYHLVVGWETLENHTVDFRESDSFLQWRALAGPYFVSPPNVVHMNTVMKAF